MPKKIKKETLADLQAEIDDTSSTVADGILKVEEKAGEAIIETVKTVESTVGEVKRDKIFKKLLNARHIKKMGFAALLVVAVGGVAGSAYFYNQYNKAQVLGTQNDYSEVQTIVESVGKLMELPSDEPTVATVSDVEKLKSQPFFDRAANGDKVLIYQTTRKAILYRPSSNKIIDVATVNLGDQAQQPAASEVQPEPEVKEGPYSVVIWNGTTTTGLTVAAEKELTGVNDIEITDRDNARKRDYEQNIIVNVGGVPDKIVQELASEMNADIVSLPTDETKPDADVLIILGSEFIGSTSEE